MLSSGSFSPQIQKFVNEGRKHCGWILRIFKKWVPNIGNDRIQSKTHQRRGRECFPPKVNQHCSGKVQNFIYASLPVHGQQFFNCLQIRNMTKFEADTFKESKPGDSLLDTTESQPPPGVILNLRREWSTDRLEDSTRLQGKERQRWLLYRRVQQRST